MFDKLLKLTPPFFSATDGYECVGKLFFGVSVIIPWMAIRFASSEAQLNRSITKLTLIAIGMAIYSEFSHSKGDFP